MSTKKLAVILSAVATFGLAACAEGPDKKAAEAAKLQDQAYATSNGCKLDYPHGEEGETYADFTSCNTDPQKRGSTKAQEAADKKVRDDYNAWREAAPDDGVEADVANNTTTENVKRKG
jgi:hypothetical protein